MAGNFAALNYAIKHDSQVYKHCFKEEIDELRLYETKMSVLYVINEINTINFEFKIKFWITILVQFIYHKKIATW